MTALEQEAIDFDALDTEYKARVELTAGDWLHGDEDYAKFVAALMRSRRGPHDHIHVDDVRALLTEDTIKGPRISINPRRFSAFWNRARTDGLIDFVRDHYGEVAYERSTTSTTGNNGRFVAIRRWTGGMSP